MKPSLGVLDLLADFFEFGFGGDDVVGDFGVVALGAHGVELAEEFLEEEIQAAAGGGAAGEVGAELLHVAGGAGEFFGDVGTVCEEGDFFDEALVIQREGESGVFEALAEYFALVLGDGGGFGADGFEQGFDGCEP